MSKRELFILLAGAFVFDLLPWFVVDKIAYINGLANGYGDDPTKVVS